jgi:HprK-related kinase A
LILADVPSGELRSRLAGPGLRLRIGPVVAEIVSSFRTVESALALHYAGHDVVPASEFADFHVAVEPPAGVRRFVAPQAYFKFDDHSAFLPLPAAQAFPLLEWGLNWCISVHCHQYLIIHAAVVERGGRALILPAPPGSGKSTLCAALVARGWRLLSDELALVELSGRTLIPMPRPISLKNRAIEAIRAFWPEAGIGAVVPDTVKGCVAHVRPPIDSVRRAQEPATPGWIVLPRFEAGAITELRPLPKCDAFMRLVDSAFNYNIHGRTGFTAIADVVDSSACHTFAYGGALDEAANVFDDLAKA